MNSLFSQDFLNTSASDICDEIAKNSFFSKGINFKSRND